MLKGFHRVLSYTLLHLLWGSANPKPLQLEGGNGLPQKLNTTRSLFFRCGMMLETTFNFGFCIILQQKLAQ